MEQKSEKTELHNAARINWTRCILAIITCTVLCVSVFLGVVALMLGEPDALVQETGAKSFRMFTVLSNMMMAVASGMCIPFAVEGIRRRNYHLPQWVMNFLFASVTSVTLTFIIAATALSAVAGLGRIMVDREGIYLHTLGPILAIVLFLFINSDHEIRFKTVFLAVLPMVCYSVVYAVLAFAVGEEAGGWRDHYQFNKYIPWYFVAPLMYLLTLGIAFVLRLVHNKIHAKRKSDTALYYQESEEFAFPEIRDAVRALAERDRKRDLGGDIIVPRRIVKIMEEKYKSGLPLRELLDVYLETYLKKETEEESENE